MGIIFMQWQPHFAIIYLTKYLLASWKLDDMVGELNAYDLLGKYFFYVGDVKRA